MDDQNFENGIFFSPRGMVDLFSDNCTDFFSFFLKERKIILRKFIFPPRLFEKRFFSFFFGIERLGQKRSGLFANGMLLLPLEYSCLHRVEQSKYYPSTGKTRFNGSSSSSWPSLFEPIIRIFQAFLHLSPIFPFHFYSFAAQDQLEGNRRRHRFHVPKKEDG